MAEFVKIPDDLISDLLESIRVSEPVKITPRRRQLREFVALVSAFEAKSLPKKSTAERTDPELDEFLIEDCERVVTRQGQRWSLRSDVRAQTLAALEHDGRLSNFIGATDEHDVGCTMARRYISGQPPNLNEQSLDELQGTALASEWLAATSVRMPSPVEARARQVIENMLRPLRILVADGFVGRVQELERLSDYSEVLTPTKRLTGATRRVRRILKMSEQPPLLIYGPGGVGKSTLVARFVLDHIDARDVYRFPFAYLSFDRPELRIEQPLTLLAEAATQLAAFFPGVASEATALVQTSRSTVASAGASLSDRRASKSSWIVSNEQTQSDEQILVERFAGLIERATGTRDLPNVWVLDTFEVAQRQSPTAIDRLWDFLERFQTACPRLRLVLCGRSPIEGRRTLDVPLGELDPDSALELLRMQLTDLALPDEFLASVVRVVSAQPISLRLAVLLLRDVGSRTLDTEEGRRDVLFRLRGNEVQGVLYRRILDHIEDPDVRKIAHPGLVVRRITTEVIREVLARPCGIYPMTESRAAELFDLLAGEVALVRQDGPDGLVQRTALRQVMLPMMRRDNLPLVEKMLRAALRFFAGQDSFSAKVEELYYRLSLGQATTTLDAAFDVEAATQLVDVVEEFPPSSQVYLANRLDLTVDPDVLASADDLSWARQAALSARRLLDAGKADAALEVVSARRSDAVIPLVAPLKVEALATLGRFGDALDTARQATSWAADHHDPTTFIDVALLAARIAEDMGHPEQALRWLRDVETSADAVKDHVARFAAQVAVVRVHRKAGSADSEEALTVRAALIRDIDQLTARDRSRNPALVRDLAAEIGDEVPAIARDALRLGGFSSTSGKKRRKRRAAKTSSTQSEQGQQLIEALDADESGEVSEAVTETFRSESEQSAF
jgi:hypothetical protein